MYLNSPNFDYIVDKGVNAVAACINFQGPVTLLNVSIHFLLEIEVTRCFLELFVTVTQVQPGRFKVSQTFVFLLMSLLKKMSLSRAIMKLLRV